MCKRKPELLPESIGFPLEISATANHWVGACMNSESIGDPAIEFILLMLE